MFIKCLQGRPLQIVASIAAAITTMSCIMTLTWSTPILPQLKQENSPIGVQLDDTQIGLLSFTVMIGSAIGNVLLVFYLHFFGRKWTLLVMAIPCFISWIMLLFAESLETLFIARIIMGLGETAPIAVAVIYIGEITDPKIRGAMSLVNLIMAEIGGLLCLIIGPVSYKSLAIVGAAVPILFCSCFIFAPDSPYDLWKKGDYKQAEKVINRLKGTEIASDQLELMKKEVENSVNEKIGIVDLFKNRGFKKALFIVFGIKTIIVLTGSGTVGVYMTIIYEASETSLDPDLASIISIAAPFPFMMASSYFIEKFGRKFLLYVSVIGSAFALFLLSLFFYLKNNSNVSIESISLMPIFGVFLLTVFKAIGILPISYLLQAELFPSNVKGLSSTILMVYGSLLGSLVLLGAPIIGSYLGLEVLFFIFIVFCILGAFFIGMYVPETKGKSLAEIQELMQM